MSVVAQSEHQTAAGKASRSFTNYSEAEDLINIGAYVKGSNPKIDNAIDKIDPVNALLKQQTNENILDDRFFTSRVVFLDV